MDPTIKSLGNLSVAAKSGASDAIYNASLHVCAIRRSLDRTAELRSSWAPYTIPVYLQESTRDNNGIADRGVEVIDPRNGAPSYISDGVYESPLVAGDVILAINGELIFNEWDIFHAVCLHSRALSLGVEKPILIAFERAGVEYTASTTYRFVPEAWPADRDAGAAAIRGFLNSVVLGFCGEAAVVTKNGSALAWNLLGAAIEAAGGEPLEKAGYVDPMEYHWETVQRTARLRQFHPEEFGNGEVVGMFASVGNLVRGALVRGTRRSLAKSIVETAMVEAVEAGVMTANQLDPTRTYEEIRDEIADMVPRAAVVGVVFGVITRAIQ